MSFHWWMLYGLVTALTIWMAFGLPERHVSVRQSAYLLGATWLLSNLSHLFVRPYHGQFFPLMDGVMGAVFVAMWLRGREAFLLGIAVIFLAMTSRHAIFFNAGDNSFRARYAYDAFLNLAYLAQLTCVALQCLMVKRTRLGERHAA